MRAMSLFFKDVKSQCNMSLIGQKLVVHDFRYLNVINLNDSIRKAETDSRIMHGNIGDALRTPVNGKKVSVEYARSFLDGVLVPTVMYGCDNLVFLSPDR